MGSFNKLAPWLCCALLMPGLAQSAQVTAAQSAGAAAYVDVLDLPAKPSALARQSPLLDLAQAGKRLVAVGQRGHILYSDDDGRHWQQAGVPVSVDLTAVAFPSPEQGWAVGGDGVVLHSADGGASWQKQLDGRQINALLERSAAEPDGFLCRLQPPGGAGSAAVPGDASGGGEPGFPSVETGAGFHLSPFREETEEQLLYGVTVVMTGKS